MNWFAYSVSPIDFCWGNLKTVEETARELGGAEAYAKATGASEVDMLFEEGPTLDDFLGAWESAKEAAYAAGWEGDFRHKPVVFWVPTSTTFDYGFAFKQDNNGETFVISPVPMPWLENA